MEIFQKNESRMRSCCRTFGKVLARESMNYDEDGIANIDFLDGSGSLNHDHNPLHIRGKVIDDLAHDKLLQNLDMCTQDKQGFKEEFVNGIPQPRFLDCKIMFIDPTGTNTVEAALKLPRKMNKRMRVVAFTNGYHGMTLGSMAVTGNAKKRAGAGVPLEHVVTMPYDGFLDSKQNILSILEWYLEDESSGLDKPAALIERGLDIIFARSMRDEIVDDHADFFPKDLKSSI